MAELADEIYEQIEAYSEQGNDYCDEEEWEKAIMCFNKALELLPEPKDDWEAATWLYVAIGDALYFMEKYEEALDNLNCARMCPDGIANPFIFLRMGQCFYEIESYDKATEYLLQAYMLEGYEIFEDEEEKYIDLIRDKI